MPIEEPDDCWQRSPKDWGGCITIVLVTTLLLLLPLFKLLFG